ncbi:MAG: FAD:protein FMN transferase [Chloroflexales bacterium]|nr:FAD:protein FMN transferase [Chloroflexales bacterium]
MNIVQTTRKAFTRRQALCMLAGGAGVSIAAALGGGLAAQRQPHTIQEMRLLMGTLVSLTLVGADDHSVRATATALFDRMAELESIMSCFKTDSQVSILNREGCLSAPSSELYTVVQHALTISTLSGGAYDPTVKPLSDLYAATWRTQRRLPTADAIARARARVDYRNLIVTANELRFAQPGMGLTLNSIAKGYIVDAGVAILNAHGFTNVLVDAGGDLRAAGTRALGQAWQVGIATPRAGHGAGLLAEFGITDGAIATSGDYQQAYTDDRSQHHILDPRTGYSPQELASVTVTAPHTALADGLSTAVLTLGVAEGLALMRRFSGCEAYLVTKALEVVHTPGFARYASASLD